MEEQEINIEKEKLENTDFFDKTELRRAGRRVKNTDGRVPKKKHTFAKVLLVLLILIIAGGCIYYFVIDTPKIFYSKIMNKAAKATEVINEKDNNNLSYSVNAEIKSNDKDAQKMFDVINQIDLEGTIKVDNKKLIGSNNVKYKKDELIDFNYLIDSDENLAYLKVDKALDKVIKVDIETDEDEESTYSVNKEDYKTVYTSFIKSFKEALTKAEYKREITKVNKSYVFKETLVIDEEVAKDLYNKLLHDDKFLSAAAKIEGESVSEISDRLNKEISDTKDMKDSKVDIYRIPITNEVLKIEILDEDDNYTITKDKDIYNYKIKTAKDGEYKGYFKVNTVKDETRITFNCEDPKDEITVTFNLSYSKNVYKVEEIDTEKAVDYTKLTEDDMNKVVEYVTKNKTFNTLLDDMGVGELLSESNSNM